jgi:hypothetical protein
MNRAEKAEFVWALIDSASAFLSKSAYTWLCVKIGAGEQRSVLEELLDGFVRNDTTLPAAQMASLWTWVVGFIGTDGETAMRDLATRIRVASSDLPTDADHRRTARLVPEPRNSTARNSLISAQQ